MGILTIEGLKKSFDGKMVIDGLDLDVNEHEIYGFIGNNGAGKTTTMNMVLGLLKPDDGVVHVSGERVTFGDTATNRHVGYLPDVPQFYPYMNAVEYLKLCADITGMKKGEQMPRIEELLRLVGLHGEKTRIRNYSRGMRQRLGIAQALIHRPRLLICDEPTSALDPKGRLEILNILREIRKETAVIFSTHILTDVERICDRVGILYEGRLVQEMDMHETFGDLGIIVEISDEAFGTLSPLIDISHMEGQRYLIENASLEDVYSLLNAHDIYPSYLVRKKKSLEDIYLEVTT